jgi:hypothetical protein
LENASRTTKGGDPCIRDFLPNGVLQPGQGISPNLFFEQKGNVPVSYTLHFLSWQGNP